MEGLAVQILTTTVRSALHGSSHPLVYEWLDWIILD